MKKSSCGEKQSNIQQYIQLIPHSHTHTTLVIENKQKN